VVSKYRAKAETKVVIEGTGYSFVRRLLSSLRTFFLSANVYAQQDNVRLESYWWPWRYPERRAAPLWLRSLRCRAPNFLVLTMTFLHAQFNSKQRCSAPDVSSAVPWQCWVPEVCRAHHYQTAAPEAVKEAKTRSRSATEEVGRRGRRGDKKRCKSDCALGINNDWCRSSV